MVLYAATIFLSAFLLFQIQPMIAKMILPWFGGSAAVWITAMLFFQSALLAGYLYAHWLIRSLLPHPGLGPHGPACRKPFAASRGARLLRGSPREMKIRPCAFWRCSLFPSACPISCCPRPVPLIQAWYSRRHQAVLPYRLFALSNFASLAGLLAYPVLIEPNVTLRFQSLGWSAAYVLFVVLAGWAALQAGENKRQMRQKIPLSLIKKRKKDRLPAERNSSSGSCSRPAPPHSFWLSRII